MAKLYARKKVLYAKVESVPGVAETLTGAAAIQTKDLKIMGLEGDVLEFDVDRPNFGANLTTLVGKHVRVSFKVAASGSGAAGTAPAYGPLLQACGHSEAETEDVDVQYKPVDTSASLTMGAIFDKVRHTCTFGKGSVKLTVDKRGYPWFEFDFMALFSVPVADASPLTPVFTPWKKPVPFRASTVACTLIGQTVGLHKIGFDFGQKVEFYEHSEEESIQITDRQSKFDAEFEETEIGTHNYWADVNSENTGALTYTHGTTAGNIVEITSPLTQLTKIDRGDQQGVSSLQVSGPLVTDGTSPDYTITVK